MLSPMVKRPGLLTDVFLRQQDESQSNDWPGFDRPLHISRVVEFEAHNARLDGRFPGSDVERDSGNIIMPYENLEKGGH